MLKDIAYVKDKYGEKMSHFVRDNFSSILEEEGLIISLLESNFAPNKYLYNDLVNSDLLIDFKNYINGLVYEEEKKFVTGKTPFELMDEAGYVLYECQNVNEIEKFRNYYEKDEELCTFKGNRLITNYVFFAVKKNINSIVRSDEPKREDEYGTSVISIQFTKGKVNTLSIKNRYNHTVKNPDATFGNNLERIIPGLTDSFTKNYNLNINSNKGKFDVTNLDYVQAKDEKFYPYNYEINNIYYGPNNIIIDNGKVIDKYSDKSRYIILDYFIFDLSEKKIFLYDKSIEDSFINNFNNIEKVSITKIKEGKILTIINSGKECAIKLDKQNRIISYENNNISIIDNNFLTFNKTLKEIEIENVFFIGNNFLRNNKALKYINLPNVTDIKDNFLYFNEVLEEIYVNNCKYIGNNFLYHNNGVKNIDLKNVIEIGDNFILSNINLENINISNAIVIGNKFLFENKCLKNIKLNALKEIGDDFLTQNEVLEYIYAPQLEIVGDNFLYFNLNLESLDLRKLKYIGDDFLAKNIILKNINIPSAEIIGNCFLLNNQNMKYINLNKVKEIGMNFMYYNIILENIDVNSVELIGNEFLHSNQNLRNFKARNLIKIKDLFMPTNTQLLFFDVPNVKSIGDKCLYSNLNVLILSLNNLLEVGDDFFYGNKKLLGFDAYSLNTVGENFLYSNINMKHFKAPVLKNKGDNYLYSNPNFRHMMEKKKCLKIS